MQIKELSKLVNLPIPTIRYYEKIGLIKPIKQGYYKQYTDAIKEELLAIDRFHKTGLTLNQIQSLFILNQKETSELTSIELNQLENMLLSTIETIHLKQEQLVESQQMLNKMLLKIKALYENCK